MEIQKCLQQKFLRAGLHHYNYPYRVNPHIGIGIYTRQNECLLLYTINAHSVILQTVKESTLKKVDNRKFID